MWIDRFAIFTGNEILSAGGGENRKKEDEISPWPKLASKAKCAGVPSASFANRMRKGERENGKCADGKGPLTLAVQYTVLIYALADHGSFPIPVLSVSQERPVSDPYSFPSPVR